MTLEELLRLAATKERGAPLFRFNLYHGTNGWMASANSPSGEVSSFVVRHDADPVAAMRATLRVGVNGDLRIPLADPGEPWAKLVSALDRALLAFNGEK